MNKNVTNDKAVSNNNNDTEDTSMIKKLNMNKIKENPIGTIPSKEALKDVTPIQWSEDVVSGKKKVTVK
ncbi:MAG: hypothetical protein ACRDD7_07455 [Peptostreptococcaceae bacterium]